MAWHASAIKRLRRDKRKQLENKSKIATVRTCVKKAREEKSPDAIIEAQSALARAASKGLLHKNTAARKIGRLMKQGTGPKP